MSPGSSLNDGLSGPLQLLLAGCHGAERHSTQRSCDVKLELLEGSCALPSFPLSLGTPGLVSPGTKRPFLAASFTTAPHAGTGLGRRMHLTSQQG